jgi:hypothetical protein
MLPRLSSILRSAEGALGTLFAFLLFAVFGGGIAFGQGQTAVGDRVQIKLTPTGKAQFVGEEGALPTSVSNARTGVSALDQVAQAHGVTQMERVFRPAGKHEPRHVEWGLDRWYTVQYQSDAAPEAVARDYLDVPQVAAASPVYKKKMTEIRKSPPDEEPSYVPDDPEYDQQWHYNNTGQTGGTPDADIDLPEAHNITTGTPNVVISIVDSGLDLDHPDFQGMLWINEAEDINNNGQFDPTPASEGGDLDGVDNDNNGFVDDVVGYNHADDDPVPSASGDHGTHVTGTVAAKNDNGEFVAGVAGGGPNGSGVRLMINQTFGASVSGFPEAITYAADNGAIVSQNSWGYTSQGTFEQAVLDAIDYFRANAGGPSAPMDGGLFVNAAGNSNSDGEWYPGFYGPSTAVTSTDDTDTKSSFSNYGSWVDIAAPGSNVLSTVVGGSGTLSGTSMAAPHVSGVIGLVASANPGLTDDQMEALLINTGDDISDNQPEIMGPRVNAFSALSSGGVDETPPGAITDLSVLSVNQNAPGASATLEWTAPGDDGDTTGTASAYDLRYSTDGPIDDSTSWADATPVEGLPLPDTVGTVQSVTISNGLPFGETVHFGLRASDEFGNTSALGNSPSADTPPAPVLAYSPDSLSAELETGNDTSLTLSLSNEGPAETSLQYSFPDFAAQALLDQADVERNATSSVISDAGYEKGSDPHAGIGHPVRTGAGGPDEYGYSWIDSNEPGGPAFQFNDISDVGTATGISDLESIEVPLPFTFEYYGQQRDSVKINNNGFVFFEGALDGYFSNAEIPTAEAPNGVLAAFWDDLDPEATGAEVYTYHDEAAGQFIVQWDEVPAFFGDVPMTFQVVLSQDGTIRYNLLDIDENDNDSATLGIESPAGDDGLQVAFNAPYPEDSLSIAIAATPDFITDVSPASGSLGGGESDDVSVALTSEDIEPGAYEKALAFTTNDPEAVNNTVPTSLSVTTGPPAIALEPDTLGFGDVLVGDSATATFTIDNAGGGPLEVSSVSYPEAFAPVDSAGFGPITVPFGETRDVEVVFTPSSAGSLGGDIEVSSNAENAATASLLAQGTGVLAPNIEVSPLAISDSLAPGDSSATTLTVSNTGSSPLTFDAVIGAGGENTAPADVAASAVAPSGDASGLSTAGSAYDGPTAEVGPTATTYQVDDGTSENALGLTDGGDVMWLNAFEVVEGAGTITEIASAWGSSNASGLPTDKPAHFLIYEDPNDDGDPSDAVLLEQVSTTVQAPHTDQFTSEAIPPTSVEGTFFIAALYQEQEADTFPMPMDESSTSQGASWIVGNSTPGGFNVDDLAANDVGPDNLEAAGFPANWLLRAEGGAQFVAVSPSADTLAAGASQDLTASFNATGLAPDVYTASIVFNSNDPDTTPSVDATLEVSAGPPAIAVEPDSVDFGSVLVGADTTASFVIENTGGEPLEISELSFPEETFTPAEPIDTPFTIPFEGSVEVPVVFAPGSAGAVSGAVSISSNAENAPTTSVYLEGEGLEAPELAYAPDTLATTLASGESTTLPLTVSNEGAAGSTLEFSFPDFAAQALLDQADVERNATSSVISDAGYEKGSDPHAGIGHPVRTGAGGPDEYGYSWIDSNEPGGPAFQFNDISDVGTPLDISDDFGANPSPEVALPFEFEFYGEAKTAVRVDNNGFLHFDSPSDNYFSNAEIPTAEAPNGVLAAFWDDLDPEATGAEVYTYHDEAAGQFIVQWDEVPAFFGDVPMTFQVVLSQDGTIRYNLLDIDENDNDSATLGIESPAGDDGLQVAFNAPYPEDSLSIAIAATPDFITDVSPASGSLGGGESAEVSVDVSAEGIEAGEYVKGLALTTNDLNAPNVEVPTVLTVGGDSPGDCPLAWSLDIATTDDAALGDTLTLGQGPAATAGLDPACGEVEQPPVPPAPTTDVRFTGTDLEGVSLGEGTLVDIRPDSEPTPAAQNAPAIWRIDLQTGDYPVSMAWDNDALAGATSRPVELVDAATGGDVVSVDMKATGSASIENSAVTALEVRLGQADGHTFTLTDGWNFKSMPVQTADMSFGAMMDPCESGFAYTPGEGYDPLEVGEAMGMGDGYWFNCSAGTHTVTGSVPTPPTAEAGAGWNVVGPYADSVDVASIGTEPSGILGSAFYGFDPISGYTVADTLAPGQAYWVKTSEAGVINFAGSAPASPTLAAKMATRSAKKAAQTTALVVSDANGRSTTLQVGTDLAEAQLRRNALPPKPPAGIFDVRFEGGRSVASFDADAEDALAALDLQGATYPITLRLEDESATDLRLQVKQGDGAAADVQTLSTEQPSVTLQSAGGTVHVGPQPLPEEFALKNSYPNPVAGQATINYALPEQSQVTLEVYDVLGRRVATLVNREKEAGEYSVRLDAADLSSGNYFYRMRAGDFTQTRRLVVVR